MDLNLEIVTQGSHHLLNLLCQLASGRQHQSLALQQAVIQLLENARAESGSLACARLGLLDHIQTLCKWHNATLLDR
jgi:hypothetical protein